MKKNILLFALLYIPSVVYANCWVVSGLQGKSAFSGDDYAFIDDAMSGASFKLSIDERGGSLTNMNGAPISEINYVPISRNTMIGHFQAGGGVTVETWSVTTDLKVLYSKVMNIPGMNKVTSTKAFVGTVTGTCDK
jgi:hypothetical protein